MFNMFARIIRHEVVTLLCAVGLMMGSLWEVGDTLVDDVAKLDFSTAHGVLLFGTVHALRATQELFESRDSGAAQKEKGLPPNDDTDV